MPHADLWLARRQIEEGELRIAEQKVLIERLRAGGCPTKDAEELLATMLEILQGMRRRLTELERASKK